MSLKKIILMSVMLTSCFCYGGDIAVKNPHVIKIDMSEDIDLQDHQRISQTRFLTRFEALTDLNLARCASIPHLEHIITITTLEKLNLKMCHQLLFELPKLAALVNLKNLNVSYIYQTYNSDTMNNLPSIEFVVSLTKLRKLNLKANHCLKSIEPVLRVPTLEVLDVRACDSLIDSYLLYYSTIETIKPKPILPNEESIIFTMNEDEL